MSAQATFVTFLRPMPRKFLRKYLPHPDSVRANRHFARFPALHHPNLWHLNRRSVAGGVAVGMFSGLVPGPLQMLTAAALAIPLRVNLPVALATTLYTNPFTIGPLYVLAFFLGRLFVGDAGALLEPPEFVWSQPGPWLAAMLDWAVAMGKPLAIGLLALALVLAGLGYVFVQCAWRIYVVLAWRKRARQRSLQAKRCQAKH
jgi:uncharacterized protein (DUF2062 family)